MAVYSYKGIGDENFASPTKHCYLGMLNIPVHYDKNKELFAFYAAMIQSGHSEYMQPVDIEITNPELREFFDVACDEKGNRLLDYAILNNDAKMVKYLIEECDVNINTIPCSSGETTFQSFMQNINSNDKDFNKKVKLAAYLIKKGMFAFDTDAYVVDEDDDCEDTAQETVIGQMMDSTISNVVGLMGGWIEELGESQAKDKRLLEAISVFALMGFAPASKTKESQNFIKYKLGPLFKCTTQGSKMKMSQTLAATMYNYALVQNDVETDVLCDCIDDINDLISGALVKSVERDDELRDDEVTLDELADEELGMDFEGINEDEFNELTQQAMDEGFLEDSQEEEEETERESQYTFFEIVEIARGNKKYDDDPNIIALKEDRAGMKHFYDLVNEAIDFYNEIQHLDSQIKYFSMTESKRYDDSEDRFINSVFEDDEQNERGLK
ncbi:MAG: hypothetical protein IJS68_00690 [Clostridia bacterium]|nr:hypothetical protein [Clostridia bacterium]